MFIHHRFWDFSKIRLAKSTCYFTKNQLAIAKCVCVCVCFLFFPFLSGLGRFLQECCYGFRALFDSEATTWRKREVEGNKLWLVVLMKVRDGWWSDYYVKSFLCVFPLRWFDLIRRRSVSSLAVRNTPASSKASVGPKDFGKITFMQWFFVASTGWSRRSLFVCARESVLGGGQDGILIWENSKFVVKVWSSWEVASEKSGESSNLGRRRRAASFRWGHVRSIRKEA
jgi:hypothetical protein